MKVVVAEGLLVTSTEMEAAFTQAPAWLFVSIQNLTDALNSPFKYVQLFELNTKEKKHPSY